MEIEGTGASSILGFLPDLTFNCTRHDKLCSRLSFFNTRDVSEKNFPSNLTDAVSKSRLMRN